MWEDPRGTHSIGWLLLLTLNIVISCAMPQDEQIPVPPATFVQYSQFYPSLGSPGSFSSMILDVPQSISKTSPKSPVLQIDDSQSLSSVLHIEASALPSTSAHNDSPLAPNNSAEPSPLEDALAKEFIESIVISGRKSDKTSEPSSSDIDQGEHAAAIPRRQS
jgi:hypothetical protein